MKQESLKMFLKCCLATTITNVNLAMSSRQMALRRRKLCHGSKSETSPWSTEVAS